MFRTWWQGRRWWIALSLLAMLIICLATRESVGEGSSRNAAFAALLSETHEVSQEDMAWLRAPSATGHAGVLFLASEGGALPDLFYAEVRGDDDTLFDLRYLSNLTHTASSAEASLTRVDTYHVAYASRLSEGYDAIGILNLRGEPKELTKDWSSRAKFQNAISNLQNTGRKAGFGRMRLALAEVADSLRLSVREGLLLAVTEKEEATISADTGEPMTGESMFEATEEGYVSRMTKGEPGTITWIVDSVRALSFVGPEPIAWLEHRVFGVKDWFQRQWYQVAKKDEVETAMEVTQEMGLTAEEKKERAVLSATDPEIGWPPAKLTPVVKRPTDGEGEWIAVVDDPFAKNYVNAPPGFYTTFLQVDADRPWTRVYVVVWDPRQIQLRVMSGTREPMSATGATAPGIVPRDPDSMNRLVGAFNGGFQSLHGEFGMMSEGRTYLAPKPWAATVTVGKGGTVSMGSWLPPPEGVKRFKERWAMKQIPSDVVELRQNLTSVVEGETYNPWKRWWWGAAPQNDEQQVYIDRSGICLTKEGFFAYFWGKSMGADELGKAMIATRCVRGMHLDMNQRHTAFEFYNVQKSGTHPKLKRGRRKGEFEIRVPHVRGFTARGRLLANAMTPMRMPRYIRRDPRDFFYLSQKPILPGPHIQSDDGTLPEKGEAGFFSAQGLPHAGWPYAFARAFLGKDDQKTWLVRIDPARVVPLASESERAELSVGKPVSDFAWLTGRSAVEDEAVLYAENKTIGRRYVVLGAKDKRRKGQTLWTGKRLTESSGADAAIGVDQDGFIVYAERQGDVTPLLSTMQRAGVADAIALDSHQRLAIQNGDTTIGPDAFERSIDIRRSMAFTADQRPSSQVLFPEVVPKPYSVWGRIQDTRIRYQRDPDKPFRFTGKKDGADTQ